MAKEIDSSVNIEREAKGLLKYLMWAYMQPEGVSLKVIESNLLQIVRIARNDGIQDCVQWFHNAAQIGDSISGIGDKSNKVLKDTCDKLNAYGNSLRDLMQPVPMELSCPSCGEDHIDLDEWASKKHRTHLCEHCGNEWTPSFMPTVGIIV